MGVLRNTNDQIPNTDYVQFVLLEQPLLQVPASTEISPATVRITDFPHQRIAVCSSTVRVLMPSSTPISLFVFLLRDVHEDLRARAR